MNTIMHHVALVAVTLIVIAGLAACGIVSPEPAGTVQLDEQQVTTMVEGMMNGYNQADYSIFSKDMTGALKLVVSEGAFKDFCTESGSSLGQFQSVSSVKQVESDDHHTVWSATCQFENDSEEFNLTLRTSDGQIEGIDFGPFQ